MVRITIADDHEVVRRGAKALLEDQEGWSVISEASDGFTAVDQVVSQKPDVAILDISMPRLNGLDAASRIMQAWPAARILIQTFHTEDAVIRRCLEAGVRGIILKSEAGAELVAAVRAIAAGQFYFTSAIEPAVASVMRGQSAEGAGPELTTREREVVQAIAEGLSNKEIASRMNVSVRTIESHRANALQKVGVSSTGELVRWAIRNHLVEP